MTHFHKSAFLSVVLVAACTGGTGDPAGDASTGVGDPVPAQDGGGSDVVADAGGTSTADAGVSGGADAGETAGIACGQDVCDETTQECCVSGFGGGGSAMCVDTGTCQGTPAACDGPEDCGGDICCGTFNGTTCETTCEGQAAELCHTESDCSTAGDMCCSFGPISMCATSCGGPGGMP